MLLILWLLGGGILLTAGDISLKKWVLSGEIKWLAAGLAAWFSGLICLAMTFRDMNIAIASIMLVYFNVATLALAEYFLFGTTVTITKIIGGILGLAAITIMEI